MYSIFFYDNVYTSRQQQHLAREQGIALDRQEKADMKRMMRDQHKQKIIAQLEHDKQRHLDEIERVQQAREAKKEINTQIRIRIQSNKVFVILCFHKYEVFRSF